MSNKKKRNKPYKGSGAALTKPAITRVTAIKRNRPHQWWVDNQRLARPVLLIGGIVLVIVISIIGLLTIFL